MTTSRSHRLRRLAAPLTAALAVFALAGCAGTTDAASTPDADVAQDIVFALKEDPTCIDPQQTSLTTSLNIGRQLVDSLLDQDSDTGEIVGWLASDWSVNDDATQYTFTLRDGVTFSDGTALTSQVVADNFDAIQAMGSSASLANGYLAGYIGTDIVSDTEFTVNFSSPNVVFEQGATTMSLGIVSDATTQASSADRCSSIAGSGAFTLDSYVPNDSVTIVKRDGYDWASELRDHEGEAYLDSVTFPIITEASVRTGGLESGEYDVIQDLPYADEARFTTDDYTLYAKANPGVPTSLIANTANGLAGDETVRQAIQMGVDRDSINSITGSTSGQAASSVLTSSTPGYTDESDELTYDPDGAKALLEGDGWTLGSDGIYEKDGQELTITVTAFYAQDVFEVTQQELKEVGIDLELNMVSSADFFAAIASGDYELLGGGLTRTDPDVLRVLLSETSSSRWGIIDDSALEDLLQEQAQTTDTDARQDLVDQIQQTVIDEAYVIPLLETTQLHASRAGVEGIEFDSASRLNLYDTMVMSD